MIRLFLAVTAATLLSRALWPPVLPALLCLLGLRHGGEAGAKCGLLGGVLALFLGLSPSPLEYLWLQDVNRRKRKKF